jgi:hypothetical protein
VEQSAAAGPDRDNMRRQFRYEIAIAEAEERLARTEVDLLEQELARARGAK